MPQNLSVDWKSPESIKEYLAAINKTGNQALRHENYYETVEHAKEMSVHINGDRPKELLEDYRPNEPKDIHEYRLKIFQPITKSKAKKVINVLQRINNSKNYSIVFNESPTITKTANEDNSLETYLRKDYPYYGDIIAWLFDVALKQCLLDPNALVCVRPIYPPDNDNEYVQPFTYIYPSKQVIDYKMDEYYTVLLKEHSDVTIGSQTVNEGKIYHIYTSTGIIQASQTGAKSKEIYIVSEYYKYEFGEIPVFFLGGEFEDDTFPFMYESYMAGVLPYWNDALREYSDKQATFVQHVFLERVEIEVECDNPKCGTNGADRGYTCDTKGNTEKCGTCLGTGRIPGRSPYGVTSVKKESLSGEQPLFPGVQYIDKPTEIVGLLKDDIRELIDEGFSAINMDILKEVGENQSGLAKTIDRTDLDSYLMMVSNNLFDNILRYSIRYISLMRYWSILGYKSKDQLPVINKPISFDVLSANQLISELNNNSTLPENLKSTLELDIIDKKFPNDDFNRKLNRAAIELDPLPGKSFDDKLAGVAAGFIAKEDVIVSENIRQLLRAAVKEEKFFDLSYEEKINMLRQLAKGLIPNSSSTPLYEES